MHPLRRKRLLSAVTGLGVVAGSVGLAVVSHSPAQADDGSVDLAAMCNASAMGAVAAQLVQGVVIKQVPNGPHLPDGVRLVPAKGKVPAYCQVTGSYITNSKTGRTANFIATLPERWNRKYLQLGCSGTCGYLMMNDPAAPPITITAQGYPGQPMEKGYAIFGNDLGHIAKGPTDSNFNWLKKPDGAVDDDALEDYLYRADFVMADMGKAFARAFYGQNGRTQPQIARSYFNGCSQGGREALIAATRFPEKFDGIIAGSPLSDQPGVLWHGTGLARLMQSNPPAKLSVGQINLLKSNVLAQCDALDGVKDGLIQNPAACHIGPTAGVPICKPGQSGDSCLTQAQADALSVTYSATTTETGKIVQPGFAISDQNYGGIKPVPADMPVDADMRSFIGPDFAKTALVSARAGGPGGIGSTHAVVNDAAYAKYLALIRRGTILPQDFDNLIKRKGKLLWYHNLSDEALTPYMSVNRYKRLAAMHGGYAKLQQTIRLFSIPGTGHCGMGGSGPSNFDAIGALENWVERGQAPQALLARQPDPANSNLFAGIIDWSKPALRTMPLCTFPQMAHYKGKGDWKDAANWECKASDTRMLAVGRAGQLAGVAR